MKPNLIILSQVSMDLSVWTVLEKGLVNVDEELQHETVTAFMSFPFDFITLNKEIWTCVS